MRRVSLFIYIAFLLIIYLRYCTAVVADETGERRVYIINPGDQLLITVVGHEKELTELVVVRPDGMITYPIAGDVLAAGLTIERLSSVIGERLLLSGHYEEPQVTVQLKEIAQEIIYVSGDVKDPGQKTFPKPVSVFEALAAAGWFQETADLANARILKRRKEVVPVDLKRLLESGVIDQHIVSDELLSDRLMLEDGDVLIIPSAIKEEQVNIIGYVNKPGQYPVKSAVTLIEALALAGGALEPTADLRHIRIIKADGSVAIADVTRSWAEAGQKQDTPVLIPHQNTGAVHRAPANRANLVYQEMVQPGDSVFVPEREKVNILGSVKKQGQFAVDDEISIIAALTLAGIDENANLGKLRIVRSTGEQVTVDASKIWRQPGQEIAAWRLGPGDTLIVPRAFRINWSAVSAVVLVVSTLYAMFRK